MEYYKITEAGQKIDDEVMNWLVAWHQQQNKNIVYWDNGKVRVLGNAEFRTAFNQMVAWGIYSPIG